MRTLKGKCFATSLGTIASIVTVPAHAQQGETRLEEITVIGSRLNASGPAEDAALPVVVLDAAALAASGAQTISDLFLKLPQFSGSRAARDGDGSARATLNLRGLGDQYTLTLVNGRRFAANAAANINPIPVSAIERIEILEAGAGAVYGSEAVAGVVNVVLKSSAAGPELHALYGNVTEGSAAVKQAGFSVGNGTDGEARYFFAADYYQRDPLWSHERDLTASNDMRAFEGGRDNRSTAGNPARIGAFLPGQPSFIIINTDRIGRGQTPTSPADFRAYDFERDGHDRVPAGTTEISATERTSFYLSAESPLGNAGTKVFVDAIYANERTWSGAGTNVVNLADPAIGGVPASNPYNVFGVDINTAFNWRALDIDGPYPGPDGTTGARGITRRETSRFVTGLRHTFLNEYDFQLSATYFTEQADTQAVNAVSRSGTRAALRRSGPTALNPFCNACNTPEQLFGVRINQQSRRQFTSPIYEASIAGPAFSLPGGEIQFAAGLEYRTEREAFRPDSMAVANDIADAQPQVAFSIDRSVKAAYTEFKIPLLAGATVSQPLLQLGLALRYEDYSDFGSGTRPLASLRWQAAPSLALRGSYGQSFRAPYLQQIAPLQTGAEVIVLDPQNNNANTEAQAIFGGNPNLSSEEADTWTIGAIFEPSAVEGLRLSADFYNIEQTDLIISPSPQAIISGLVPGTVRRGPGIGSGGEDVIIEALFTNIAGRKMQGVDARASYARELGAGELDLSLGGSYLLKMKTDTRDGRGFVEYAGEYTVVAVGSGFGGLPELRADFGATYRLGGLSANASVFYIDSYLDARATAVNPNNPRKLDSYQTLDLNASYDFAELGSGSLLSGLTLEAGVENVFDKQPDFLRATNAYDRGLFDLRGRYFYIGANVKL